MNEARPSWMRLMKPCWKSYPIPHKVTSFFLCLLKRITWSSCVLTIIIGQIAPLTAFMGGVAAQEAIKACTGKFTPLHQWVCAQLVYISSFASSYFPSSPFPQHYPHQVYLDAVEALPVPEEGQQLDFKQFQPKGNRYDAQIICLGSDLSDKLGSLKIFMVCTSLPSFFGLTNHVDWLGCHWVWDAEKFRHAGCVGWIWRKDYRDRQRCYREKQFESPISI